MSAIRIEGRRWFQRAYGNTYHSVRIRVDGEVVATVGPCYGYGDQYETTACVWLAKNRPDLTGGAPGADKWALRKLGHRVEPECTDVPRRRDLEWPK